MILTESVGYYILEESLGTTAKKFPTSGKNELATHLWLRYTRTISFIPISWLLILMFICVSYCFNSYTMFVLIYTILFFYSHKKPGESEYLEVRRELPVSHLLIGIFVYHASLDLNCQSEIHSPSLSFFLSIFFYSTAFFFKSKCIILLICGHFYRPTFFHLYSFSEKSID